MTNTELKNNIDAAITNKTSALSITPVNVGEQIKSTVDYIDQEISNIELIPGPAGPIGPQGPQGVAGPVGPAGLNWQGQWVSGTSYIIDDAVGYNGASWFCINNTSGIISPDLDATNWALLAAQGSPGPQGPQGIQGQGSIPKTSGAVTLNGTFQVLPFDINSCSFQGGKAFLPTTTENGKEILVIATANNIEIRANTSGTNYMFQNFNTFVSSVTLLTNEMYKFTFVGFGGYWKAEKLETKPYKSYIALINQSGTNAPVATVIYNDTGSTFIWNYDDVGSYIATSSSPILLGNKTVVFVTAQGNSGNNQNKIFGGTRYNDTSIGLFTSSDGILKLNFEIRVYN